MLTPLFIPFDIRNQIINENCTRQKDISEFTFSKLNDTLRCYMTEKRIFKGIETQNLKILNGRIKNGRVIHYEFFTSKFPYSGSYQEQMDWARQHPIKGGGNMGNTFISFGVSIDKTSGKAYYKFNEASGNLINQATVGNGWSDGIGSAADGTVSGATYSVAGKIGNAFDFDGTDDRIAIADNDGWDLNGNMSIVAWVFPDTFAGEYRGIISKRASGSNVTFQFNTEITTGKIELYNGSASYQSTGSMTTGQWNFAAVTLTSGNSGIFYRDGVADGTFTSVGGRSLNTADVSIGVTQLPTTERWNGKIDELSAWGRILSSNEITNIYNGGAGREL